MATINGLEFSWSSVHLRLLGVKTQGFKAIKLKIGRSAAIDRNHASDPVSAR